MCINSRDELFVLDLDKVAYIQASGNYSRIVYIGGMQMMITLGLSKLEGMIKMIVRKTAGARLCDLDAACLSTKPI